MGKAGNYIRGDVQLPRRRHLDIHVNSVITESHIWFYTPYVGLILFLSSTMPVHLEASRADGRNDKLLVQPVVPSDCTFLAQKGGNIKGHPRHMIHSKNPTK